MDIEPQNKTTKTFQVCYFMDQKKRKMIFLVVFRTPPLFGDSEGSRDAPECHCTADDLQRGMFQVRRKKGEKIRVVLLQF